ncbi:MAG: homocysteine S-methyltransferase family protein, partial [Acidobacteriales bacterium]|nr:homocysteine S-methyltransferase family protein [Terriglobales bacterium]
PLGTELEARGVPIPPIPWWTAWALKHRPDAVSELHRDYAHAGATVHTTCTFRTRRRNLGDEWESLAARAVKLARDSVPPQHRIAGGVAPLEDCYRPDLSPGEQGREEHRELARLLASEGVDLLLCETFSHVGEALAAVEECVATGVETWVSFTSGPENNLLTLENVATGAEEAVRRGARAVLINCIPATKTLPYVERIATLGVPYGAYANAGAPDEGLGWDAGSNGARAYADLAALWIEAGATLIGSCCGTSPAHIAELKQRFVVIQNRERSDRIQAK